MQLSLKDRIVYAEVMQVLKYFDRDLIIKIPIEIIEYFKENRDEKYISKIDKEDIFNKNNISREALSILAYLDLTYWTDEETKKTLLNQYRKNEYSNVSNVSDDIFKSSTIKNEEKNTNRKNVQIIEYRENIFIKILNKFKEFIHNRFNF